MNTIQYKMKCLIAPITIWIILQFCGISSGQNVQGDVYGQVIDKQSHITLPGANIIIYSQGKSIGTVTDCNGQFSIKGIPVGRFDIEVSFVGYNKTIINNIVLTSGKSVFLDIELLERIERLDEFVVKAFSKDEAMNEFATVSARTFSVEETNKYAGSWGDPARMVSNYAGVIAVGDQRNDIIVRGNSPTGLLWRLDGIVIPNPNHFGSFGTTGGPISILNNNQLSNSDFFTSAFPAEFGNSLSGVFDLKMRNGNTHKHEFIGQMGFNGFEIGAEGPLSKAKRSSYMMNYRYTMMDIMNAIGMFDVGGVPNYTDISFKFFIPTEDLGTFSFFGLGGMSKMELLEHTDSGWTSEMLPSTQVFTGSKMGAFGLTNKYFLPDDGRIESSISVSHSNSFNEVDTLRSGNYINFYNENYAETRYTASTKYVKKVNARNTIQTGAILEVFDFNFYDETFESDLNDPIHNTNIKDYTSLYQGYVQLKHRLTDGLSMNLGLHAQIFALNGSRSIEPRFGVKYSINNKHSLSIGYGLHGQIQPRLIYFNQTLVDTLNGIYTLTNKELDFTKSHHGIVGYNYSITKNLRLIVEAYYQYLYDVPVEQSPSHFSMLNYGANFYNERRENLINDGTGFNKGVELTLEKFLSNNYYFMVTASLFDSKYQGSDMIWRNTAFNSNYTINLLAGYEIPIGNNIMSFNIKMVTAGGRRFIPIDLASSIESGIEVLDYSNAYIKQYDEYFRADFRLAFRKNSERIAQEWSFDIQNLTDHRNVLTQRYDSDTESVVDIMQMAFFPIGSYRIYF